MRRNNRLGGPPGAQRETSEEIRSLSGLRGGISAGRVRDVRPPGKISLLAGNEIARSIPIRRLGWRHFLSSIQPGGRRVWSRGPIGLSEGTPEDSGREDS